ncbi:MAG: ParA family protein [Bradymonadia bacterium]
MASKRSSLSGLLNAGLDRLRTPGSSRPQKGSKQATVIAVAAQKGGVGKTTTVVNLACALAERHGKKVLVVDIDPQGHVTSSLRESVRPAEATLSEILLANKPRDLLDAVAESAIDGLWLTGPDKALNDTESQLASKVGREMILRGASLTARTHYDIILIDCPPNLGNLTLNALVAADKVLVPCDMSILAFEGVADLLGAVETVQMRLHPGLEVLGVVRTRLDRRNIQINQAIEGALSQHYGEELFETAIPVNSALAKAQAAGMSIFQFDKRARGAEAYDALAAEVLGRLRPGG